MPVKISKTLQLPSFCEMSFSTQSDKMAKAIEFTSIDEFVKDSEVINYSDKKRKFEYDLNEKSAKSKLIKGAKRGPFEMVKKTASSNMLFNLGSWNKVVSPSIRYWWGTDNY